MGEGESDPADAEFEADLESTLHLAVDDVTSSPDLRSAIEHAAAQELSSTDRWGEIGDVSW